MSQHEHAKKSSGAVNKTAKIKLGGPVLKVVTGEDDYSVVVSPTKLGLKNGVKLKDAYAKAEELGLRLCLNSDMRLEYSNRQAGEWLLNEMKPVVDSADFFFPRK